MTRRAIDYGLMPPDELFELAAGMRTVMEKMLVVDEPHEDLRRMRTELDGIAARLDVLGRRGLEVRLMPDVGPGPEDRRPYYAGNPTRWHYNPVNPPVDLEIGDDGVLRGSVTLGLAYEGPPGCVHGGIVAFLFDQLLGHANLEHGLPAMTASLRVEYRRPTPLLKRLSLEASPPQMQGERRCTTRGRIHADGVLTADAEGVFVLPDPESFQLPHLGRMYR